MSPTTFPLRMTDHARARAQQRGVAIHIVGTVIGHADIRVWVGGGCRSFMISRRRLAKLPFEVLSPAEREQAAGVAVMLDPAERVVVTVIHVNSRRAARYRRGFRTRSGPPSIPAHRSAA